MQSTEILLKSAAVLFAVVCDRERSLSRPVRQLASWLVSYTVEVRYKKQKFTNILRPCSDIR